VSRPIERLAPGAETELAYTLRPSRSSGAIDLPAARLEDSAGSQVAEGVAASVYIGDSVPIHAVQGAGERSPFVGQRVQVEGAVTGVFPDLGGFYLEGMAPDADTATSEGVFVATTSFPQALQIGAAARAAGTIREPGHQTTIVIAKASDLEVTADGSRPPDVPALDPPSDPVEAAAYYEAMEGMLVDVAEPARAVGPTNQYGETPLVLAKHDLDRLFRGGPQGLLITVDDGSDLYHEDRSTMPYAASTGQQLAGVRGPLAFTFGQYKIEPVEPPQVSGDPAPAPQPVDLAQSAFSVMTWNAENLFDILEPNPSSPPRPHKAEYDVDLAKVAATIRLAGAPSVVALQEIENIGILQDLAALPELDPFDYVPYLLEGTDSRGIDVGYLVRGDAGEVEAVDQLPVPEGLTSRPPLQLTLDPAAPNGSSRVVLLNNHFTALSAGVELTEPRRRAQAALNADAAAALLSDPAVGGVIVLGDLNSFYQDPSLGPLEQAGLGDALASLPGDQRYTYIFEGVSQVLDHIFLSDGLSSCLDDVRPLRADADFPPPAPTDRSALRKSDHDPLLAIFSCLP
jgi:predicted extracellular nuclease